MDAFVQCFSTFVFVMGLLCNGISCELIVLHAPAHVTFLQDSTPLQISEIPSVISSSFGFQLNNDMQWNGLGPGNLFKRPKANVVFSVEGFEELDVENIASFDTKQDVPFLDTESVVNHIQSMATDTLPLILDFSVDSNIVDVRSRHPELFRHVPATLTKIRKSFLAGEFGFSSAEMGSLNASAQTDTDLLFLGELHIIQKIIQALKSNPDFISDKLPNFYHFKVHGFQHLVEKYGAESTQVSDAKALLQNVLNQMTQQFKDLYKENVVILAVTFPAVDRHEINVRKSRSLLEDNPVGTSAPPSDLDVNLAAAYDELFPVIFNIILWLGIALSVSIIGISYGIWNMDPGRDSIIYRMTSTRMKKD